MNSTEITNEAVFGPEIDAHIHETGESENGCGWDECPLAVCQWCNGGGCQSCGWGGHALSHEGYAYIHDAAAMEAAIALAKREILTEIADGRIPATVATFSELHDYVDANEFGGLCDDDCPAEVWDAAAEIQEAVHQWLVAGRP